MDGISDVTTKVTEVTKSLVSDASDAAAQMADQPWYIKYSSILMLVLLGVVMYFLLIRPQRKRQKEEQKMRNDLRVGDEITTIGGIVGRVINIKDDVIIIETGADRNKMTIKKWALQSNDTVHDTPATDDDDDDDDI